MSNSAPQIPEMPVVPYFLVLLVPGRNHETRVESLAAHIEFIGTMSAANVILLGGEFEPRSRARRLLCCFALPPGPKRKSGCPRIPGSRTTSTDHGS